MGDVKRWSVTYTKHVKQKRKVYQDGFLEHHDSSHKMMLYDDCEKLLACRIVKDDDVVRSGETLAFNTFLVDVGDLDGDQKTIPNVNLLGRDKKITEKAGLIHGKKFKHNSVCIDRKPDSRKNKAPSNSLSPSQKVIREFKKNEMNKYGAPRNSPDTTKTSYSEWNVLYTTQITQKAKKYHDGILRVSTCGSQGRQVMLYDLTQRLLDSRFLKKDEVIGSGESLNFDGHLVDVGEPEGNHNPLIDLKVQGSNCTAGGKTGLLHGQQAQKSSKEWNVLYTTQITQKAKKYCEGILRVATCGSQGRQVTLYDVGRRKLDSRFLKKDEVIESGESVAFDGHLVDIGEPDGDQMPPVDLKVQGSNCKAVGKTGLSHGQQSQHSASTGIGNSGSSNSMSPLNCLEAVKSFIREWNALYTTQITQKAKKYHSGILRLASCNSYQMQATLLNEDGTILSRKFLKLFEDVRSGSTFELPKYLVEVGELRTSPEGEPSKNACSEKNVDSNFSGLDVGNFKLGRTVPVDNPLRDANGILSILRKTMTQADSLPNQSASVKQGHASQCLEFIQFEVQNQIEGHVGDSHCECTQVDNHDEETTKKKKSAAVHDDGTNEIAKLAGSENRGESRLKCFCPLSSSLRSGALDVSGPKISDAECTYKTVSSVEKHHDLDASKLDCPDDFQPPVASGPHDVSSSCYSDPLSTELKIGTSAAPEESNGLHSRWYEGAFSCGITNSNGCKSHDPSDNERQSSKEYESTSKFDEIPSFDLGF